MAIVKGGFCNINSCYVVSSQCAMATVESLGIGTAPAVITKAPGLPSPQAINNSIPSQVAPKLTKVMAPFFHSSLFFLGVLGVTIFADVRSCTIQDGSAQKTQEEDARDIPQCPCEFVWCVELPQEYSLRTNTLNNFGRDANHFFQTERLPLIPSLPLPLNFKIFSFHEQEAIKTHHS